MPRPLDHLPGPAPLRRARAAGVCALLLAVCGGAGAGPGDRRGEDDFSGNTLSRYTATSDDGAPWSIRDGELAGDGHGIHAVLIRDGAALETGWVETRSSHTDDGGLVLGYRDNDNYYLLSVRDDQAPSPRGVRNLAVYQRVDGQFLEMWHMDVRWPRGTARTIRFHLAEPGRVRVLVDGKVMGQGPVRPNGGTGFGLRHYGADATWKSRFDFLRWEITDGGD